MVNLSGYVWAARQLGPLEQRCILDLSCGTGYGSDYLGAYADRIVGIDCAPDVVTKSREDYPRSNVAFLAMEGCALGFRDASFDCIVSQDTIEHIQDDHRFVSELTRVLKPNGMLIIFTPHGKGREVIPSDPFHVREYTHEEFKALLAPHFSTIRWYGRRQGHRLKTIERSMDTVRNLDPAGLRNCVPRPIRHWLGSVISRVQGGPGLDEIIPDDIEYREGVAGDTNLIGVCIK
jgi:SAM-dependent methyltransferase